MSSREPWPGILSHPVLRWLGVAIAVGVPQAGPAQTVRDSAEVRIVHYAVRDRPRASWHLDLVPRLVIGGPRATGTAEFSQIPGVARLSDGSIVALDYGSNEVRVFDASGRPRRTVGRRGGGPGEFDGIWKLHRLGDTIVAFDQRSVGQAFTPDGRYLRTIAPLRSPTGGVVLRVGYLSDGGLVHYVLDLPQPRPDGWHLHHVTVQKATANGTTSLGRFPSREVLYRTGQRPVRRIYGPSTQLAALPSYVCAGYSDQYAFECFDGSGRLRTRVTRMGWTARRVTAADRQVYFEDYDRTNPGPRYAGVRAEARRDAIFAERFPAYGRFATGPVEELWVGPFVPLDQFGQTVSDEPMTWSVFAAASGEWLADVTVPAHFYLHEVGRDYVLGVARDPDDVETVVLYTLRRPAGTGQSREKRPRQRARSRRERQRVARFFRVRPIPRGSR